MQTATGGGKQRWDGNFRLLHVEPWCRGCDICLRGLCVVISQKGWGPLLLMTLDRTDSFGVLMDPFTGRVTPLEDIAFFSVTVTSNFSFWWSAASTRLWLFALTRGDSRYQREPGEEECVLTEGRGFDMWSSYTNCTFIFILYLKYWEVYFKYICRRYCQFCLSTAAAMLIYRQLYL